jgi:hypothetical protein
VNQYFQKMAGIDIMLQVECRRSFRNDQNTMANLGLSNWLFLRELDLGELSFKSIISIGGRISWWIRVRHFCNFWIWSPMSLCILSSELSLV